MHGKLLLLRGLECPVQRVGTSVVQSSLVDNKLTDLPASIFVFVPAARSPGAGDREAMVVMRPNMEP